MEKKVVIIGAGSMAFTPTLVSTFLNDPYYRGATIGLVDIHQERLDLMCRLLQRANEEWDWGINFVSSTERKDLLPDAEVVTTAFAVGGNEAFLRDLDIPAKYGFVQPDGETLGPGGISRALRHVPLALEIARDMEKLCPGARLYNYTNPMTLITTAVNKYTAIHCTGLCIGPLITKRFACEFLGIDNEDVEFIAAGLNHNHFLLQFRRGTEDLYPALREKAAKLFAQESMNALAVPGYKAGGLVPEHAPNMIEMTLSLKILDKMGYFPGPGDHHVGEFYPQWFTSTADQRARHPWDHAYINKVLKTYPGFYNKVREGALGLAPLDPEMFQVGKTWEESQMALIEQAMRNDTPTIFHINIPNRGYITNLPDTVAVEIPVLVDGGGYHPIAIGNLPATIVPYMARYAYTIELMIEAALEGSREKAMAVFANDPSCFDPDICQQCLDELIDAQKEYLPQFYQ
jgi:alpha-galactosidase